MKVFLLYNFFSLLHRGTLFQICSFRCSLKYSLMRDRSMPAVLASCCGKYRLTSLGSQIGMSGWLSKRAPAELLCCAAASVWCLAHDCCTYCRWGLSTLCPDASPFASWCSYTKHRYLLVLAFLPRVFPFLCFDLLPKRQIFLSSQNRRLSCDKFSWASGIEVLSSCPNIRYNIHLVSYCPFPFYMLLPWLARIGVAKE